MQPWIGHLDCHIRRFGGGPAASAGGSSGTSAVAADRLGGLPRRLLPTLRHYLGSALEQGLGSGDEVWVLRRVETSLWLGDDHQLDEAKLAERFAGRIAGSVVQRVARAAASPAKPQEAVRFESRAEFLGSFVADALSGQPDRWFYVPFQRFVGSSPARTALEALVAHPDLVPRVLGSLERRGLLDQLLSTLGTGGVVELWQRIFGGSAGSAGALEPASDRAGWRPLFAAALRLAQRLGTEVSQPEGCFHRFLTEHLGEGADWNSRRGLSEAVADAFLFIFEHGAGSMGPGKTQDAIDADGLRRLREALTDFDWLETEPLLQRILERSERRGRGVSTDKELPVRPLFSPSPALVSMCAALAGALGLSGESSSGATRKLTSLPRDSAQALALALLSMLGQGEREDANSSSAWLLGQLSSAWIELDRAGVAPDRLGRWLDGEEVEPALLASALRRVRAGGEPARQLTCGWLGGMAQSRERSPTSDSAALGEQSRDGNAIKDREGHDLASIGGTERSPAACLWLLARTLRDLSLNGLTSLTGLAGKGGLLAKHLPASPVGENEDASVSTTQAWLVDLGLRLLGESPSARGEQGALDPVLALFAGIDSGVRPQAKAQVDAQVEAQVEMNDIRRVLTSIDRPAALGLLDAVLRRVALLQRIDSPPDTQHRLQHAATDLAILGASAAEPWKLDGPSDDSSSNSLRPASEDEELRFERALESLGASATDQSLIRDPIVDLAARLVAVTVLRLWAHGLRGFEASSVPFLLERLLRRRGFVQVEGGRILVDLDRADLDPILERAGLFEPLESPFEPTLVFIRRPSP